MGRESSPERLLQFQDEVLLFAGEVGENYCYIVLEETVFENGLAVVRQRLPQGSFNTYRISKRFFACVHWRAVVFLCNNYPHHASPPPATRPPALNVRR